MQKLKSMIRANANHRFKWKVNRRYFRNKELEAVIDREFEPQLKAAKDSDERNSLTKSRERMKRDQAGEGERRILFELDFLNAHHFTLKQRFTEPESIFEYHISKELGYCVSGDQREVRVQHHPFGFLGATVVGDPPFVLAEAIESNHLKLEKKEENEDLLIYWLREESTKRGMIVQLKKSTLQISSLAINARDGHPMDKLEASYHTGSPAPKSVLYTKYGGDGKPSFSDEWTLESITPVTPSKTGVPFTVPTGYRVVSKERSILFR